MTSPVGLGGGRGGNQIASSETASSVTGHYVSQQCQYSDVKSLENNDFNERQT
jgi:hypothetical protein